MGKKMGKKMELCPFCGGRPQVFTALGTKVECQECGAKIYDLDKEKALSKWNRRVCHDAAQTS